MPPIRNIDPPTLARPNGFAHIAIMPAGPLIFISGQVAYDASGAIVGAGDIAAQTRQVMRNLAEALAHAGSDFQHLLKLTFFVRGLDEAAIHSIREARKEFLPSDHLPASTMVGVSALARDELLLEVEAYATPARPD